MFEIRRNSTAPPEAVFAVLADGWLFPTWVVGASRMRAVDKNWPEVESKLHHSFGVWPAVIDDETTVLRSEPPRLLVLQPKGWPVGEGIVEVRIDPWADGSVITISEDAIKGPGKLVPYPLRQVVLGIRNRETLRRLAFCAEGRE